MITLHNEADEKAKKAIREKYRVESDEALTSRLHLSVEHVRHGRESMGLRRMEVEEGKIADKESRPTGEESCSTSKAPLWLCTTVLILIADYIGFRLFEERGASPAAAVKPSDWNVVLVVVDTLRADHLSCYGYGGIETIHIDQLTEEGILFTDATAQVPLTLPSHCSIFTGIHPNEHGLRDYGGFRCRRRNRRCLRQWRPWSGVDHQATHRRSFGSQ